MPQFDDISNAVEGRSRFTRRLFIGRTARWSAALFAGAAALVSAAPAYAICRTVGCCQLAYCADCPSTSSCPSCTSGRYSWGCVDQFQHLWECVECWEGSCAGCSNAIFGVSPSP